VELEGSVALVTGAAAGTGRAIALRLGAEGAAVVVADIDVGRGEDTVRAIESRGGRASFVRAERAQAELAGMAPGERAARPTPLAMEEVAEAVVALVRDEALAGRVMGLRGGEPPRLLDPERRE
jgi:NAD(P)-dependent dehydrogenase (short-subunit alcohol dehydrogenase family)